MAYELSLFLVYLWKNFDKTRIIKENQVSEKVRTGFYIEKEVLDRCDELLH